MQPQIARDLKRKDALEQQLVVLRVIPDVLTGE